MPGPVVGSLRPLPGRDRHERSEFRSRRPAAARLGCPPGGRSQVAYGGFWIRLVAYIIDAILLSIACGVVGAVVGFNVFDPDMENYSSIGQPHLAC